MPLIPSPHTCESSHGATQILMGFSLLFFLWRFICNIAFTHWYRFSISEKIRKNFYQIWNDSEEFFFFNCFQKYSSKYSYDNHIRINFIVTNQVSLKSYIKTDTFLSRFSNLHHLSFLYPSILLERVLTRRNVSKKPPSRWQVPNSKEKLMRNNCKLFKQNKLNSYSRQWQTFE